VPRSRRPSRVARAACSPGTRCILGGTAARRPASAGDYEAARLLRARPLLSELDDEWTIAARKELRAERGELLAGLADLGAVGSVTDAQHDGRTRLRRAARLRGAGQKWPWASLATSLLWSWSGALRA
jgi:hypothetical protein